VTPPKRADARRNEEALLSAAAAVFAESGVAAPVREVAARAGVGVATIYRHFPTRADLIVAVFRHQVEECAEAVPGLLADGPTPYDALVRWVDLFVDFVGTKHGLADVLQSDDPSYAALHSFFVERLLPACTALLDAGTAAGQVRDDVTAYELMRSVGNLCAGAPSPEFDARKLVGVLVTGLARPA
jgi:AcrR family transcriptional regulator